MRYIMIKKFKEKYKKWKDWKPKTMICPYCGIENGGDSRGMMISHYETCRDIATWKMVKKILEILEND